MNDAERQFREWKDHFPLFAEDCLRVLSKSGQVVPFRLNEAQRRIMACLLGQMALQGRVRLVIDKGRQLGCSTFIAAWFYWRAVLWPGTRVHVVCHRKDATSNLAEMTRRMHDHFPRGLQIPTVARNDTTLIFDTESSYRLGTAGQSANPGSGGRSHTATHLHASEFAFWHGAGDRLAGLGQAVFDGPGTEAIVESTAQGQANALYDLWRLAESEASDWRPLFLPWFLDPAYSREPPPGYALSREERDESTPSDYEYALRHGLTLSQMYWRELKLGELSLGGEGMLRWKQEYPATAEESFVATAVHAFLNAHEIAQARSRHIPDLMLRDAHLVLGIDPATSHGSNATAFIRRRRHKAFGLEQHVRMTPDQVAERAWTLYREERPVAICIDRGEGVGDHVFQVLGNRGAPVVGIYFGGRPDMPDRFYDKRAELYSRIAAWLPEGDLPDDTDLAKDLLAQRRYPDESPRIRLVKKPDLVKDGLPSPDRSDALACTFAYVDPEAGAGWMGQATADPLGHQRLQQAGYL